MFWSHGILHTLSCHSPKAKTGQIHDVLWGPEYKHYVAYYRQNRLNIQK